MENQNLRANLLATQKVLSDYIDYNNDTEKFTKHVEGMNGKKDKKDNKRNAVEK